MGSNLVIAAIPDENDRVWKISSEKIPHLTILHLGDVDEVSNLEQIMLFVEHAASRSLRRFYLPVDRRGELGESKADVLFFKKGRYDFKAVRDFRSLLLQDQNIKTAYDAASQFEAPEQVGDSGHPWIPHLTLGYPETPAKPIPDDQMTSIYDVQFNRIAVWTGDFEGPDWLLKDYWDDFEESGIDMDQPMSVAMSDISHYGTKGMRWGVRNDGAGETKKSMWDPEGHDRTTDFVKVGVGSFIPVVSILTVPAQVRLGRAIVRGHKQKKLDMAEEHFDKHAHSAKNFVEIHNGAADRINKEIPALNARHPKDLTKDPVARKKYDDEAVKMMQDAYRESANKLGNKTGTRHLDVEFHNDGLDFKIVSKEGMQTPTVERVKHAAEDDVTFEGKIKRDATGHILGLVFDDFEEKSMAQTADLGAEFLEHFGTKGMKWGVRNAKTAAKTVGRGAKKVGKGTVTVAKDIHFESTSRKHTMTNEVHLTAIDKFNKHDVPRIDAKYKDTKGGKLGSRLKNPLHPDTRAYRSESRIAYRDQINAAVKALPGNASGTRKYKIEDNGNTNAQYAWTLKAVDVKKTVKHADNLDVVLPLDEFTVRPIFDEDGFIIDVKIVEPKDELAQTVDLGEEFLTHIGVKGMRWGHRKSADAPVAVATTATSVVPHGTKRKTKIKTEGGENHKASEDAIRVAQAHAKLKKSGTAALTNKELQDVQTRLNLERNVKQLVSAGTTAGKGRSFVKGITGIGKDINEPLNTGLNTARLVKQLN